MSIIACNIDWFLDHGIVNQSLYVLDGETVKEVRMTSIDQAVDNMKDLIQKYDVKEIHLHGPEDFFFKYAEELEKSGIKVKINYKGGY